LELWVDATTKRKMDNCPYLLRASRLKDQSEVYFCAIQEKKPERCASYVCLRKELGSEFIGLEIGS
jgi:hypothetical protein